MRVGMRSSSPVLQTLSFGKFNDAFKPARTEFDWLSRDPAEVDKYIGDPHCGFACTTQTWCDFLAGLIAAHREENQMQIRKDLPIYIFAGAMDPVSNNNKTLKPLAARYRELGIGDVTEKYYPEGRHEMLNETNRGEVTADLIAWLDAHV